MVRSIALTLTLMVLSCSTVSAEKWDRPFIDEAQPPTPASVEDLDATWKEGAAKSPPWPQDSDLIELYVDDPSSQFRQYIDGRNLSVGADGAVRYTLVVESRNGVRNISFEGLRCTPSGAFKVYAYGSNGRFVEMNSEWETIHGRSGDKIHRDLHDLVLCIPRKFAPRSKTDIIHVMQTRFPHETGTGFLPD